MAVQKSIKLWFAALLCLCLFSGAFASVFDVTLHYRLFQLDTLKQKNQKSHVLVENYGTSARDTLRQIFGDNQLDFDIYDIIESGEPGKPPLLTFKALLSSSKLDDRDSFISTWESQDTSDFLLFSVGLSASDTSEAKTELHDFHKKYSPKAQGECSNGGFVLPNNTCVCPPYFTSTDCSQITCLNSGIKSTAFRCSCPPGYIGRYCEQMGCMAAFDTEFDFKKRSFVIVLNIIRDAAFMINTVQSAVNKVLQNRVNYYNNFILSIYYMNSQLDNYFSHTSITDNFTIFQSQLSSVYANKDGQNKKQPTLGAINSALTKLSEITPKSDIYVFALTPPSDYASADPYTESSTTAESILARTLINWGHSIYTILGQSSATPFSETDSAIQAYRNLASISNGEYIYVGTTTSDAAKAFQTIFKMNYYPETISSRRGFDCSTPITDNVVLGNYDTGMFIYTSGAGITVTFNGNALTATATYGDFQAFNTPQDNTAAVIIGGATSCSYRIFTSSLESVIPGFAANQKIDISKSYPPAYIPVYAVARIVSSAPPTTLHYTAISQIDGSMLVDGGDSDSTARSDCNFPFQFSSWNCSERTFFSKLTYTEANGVTTRLIPSVCFVPIYRDPLGGPISCNGGTVISFNNTCACPPYQTGPNCGTYVCQNGGSVNPFPIRDGPKCLCKPGFTGKFCENLSCSSMSPRPDTSKKALNFVIQASNSLSNIISQIQSAAKSIASSTPSSGYFDNFVLTTFINKTTGDVSITTETYNNVTQFVSAIDGMEGGSSDIDQLQGPFAALLSTLNATVEHPWRQSLFLFVDAAPSDTNLIDLVISGAINYATSINVVLIKPFNGGADNSVVCITDFSAYKRVADTTGGIFVNLCDNTAATAVQTFVSTLGEYHYQLETVSREQVACSSTVTKTIEQNDGIQTRLLFLSYVGNYSFTVTLDGNTQPSSVTTPGIRMYQLTLPTRKNYTLVISPASGPMPAMNCSLVVGEQTGQAILAGFAQDPSIDYSSLAAQFGVASYPTIFMSTQLQSPPTVTLSFTNGASTYTSTGVMRNASSCQFDYFFNEPFGCPKPGQTFTINARFTTADGISFNRAIQSICQAPTPGTCLNGGFINPGENACTCPPGFYGQVCETRVCVNGGTLDQDVCRCPPNIGGDFCELILCDKWDYLETYDNNFVAYETIAFLLNTELSSLTTNFFLAEYITDFINAVHSNAQAKQFILVTYDNTKVEKVISTTDETKFITVFQQIANQLPNSSGNGPADVIGAIYETLRLITYKPAMLFLFSSSDISSVANFMTVNNMLGKGGIQINTILQSGKTTLPTTGKFYYYEQIAIASAGRIITLTDFSNLQNLMQTALPSTIYEGIIVEDRTYASCATPQITFFPVEYRSTWFSIFIRGDRAKPSYIQIWDASGTLVNNPSDYLTLNDDGSMWYHFPSLTTQNYAGFWKIQVETSTATKCQVQIRANTPLQTSLGFTTIQSTDFPSARPLVTSGTNGTRYITASVSSSLYQQQDAFLEYLKISTFDADDGSLTLVGEIPLEPRDPQSCAYQFVTPQIKMPATTALTAFQVQLNGQDERGNNFQQIHWYMNQAASCLNGATTDAYGLCVCTPNYTGDECDIPICQNGGTADMVVCQCQSGYYGDFCEKALLNPNTPTTTSTTPGTTTPTTTTPTPSTAPTSTTAVITSSTATSPTTPTLAPPVSTSTASPTSTQGGGQTTTTGTPSPTPGSGTTTPASVQTTTSATNVPSSTVVTPSEQPPVSTSTLIVQTTITGEPVTTSSPTSTTTGNNPPPSSTPVPSGTTSSNVVPNPSSTTEIPTTTVTDNNPPTTSGPITTRVPVTLPVSCPSSSTMNIYLNYFMDTGNGFPLYNLYTSVIDNTAGQVGVGNPTRFISLYAANANGSQPNMTELTDKTSLTNQLTKFFGPPYFSSSTSSVIDDLIYYESVLNAQLTYSATPVIVMFLNNPLDNITESITKMNQLKNGRPSTYFVGILLSTEPTISELPFDYTMNVTVADQSAPIRIVDNIFKYICYVTPVGFI